MNNKYKIKKLEKDLLLTIQGGWDFGRVCHRPDRPGPDQGDCRGHEHEHQRHDMHGGGRNR